MRAAFLLLLGLLACPPGARAGDPALSRYAEVAVGQAQSSLVIGTISVAPSVFVREGDGYAARLSIDVSPYNLHFSVTVRVQVTDEDLRLLDRGRSITLDGAAIRGRKGAQRPIACTVTPLGRSSGTLAVKVFVSSLLVFSFQTTYHLIGPP